jgi:SAM-dependent methyltransferase
MDDAPFRSTEKKVIEDLLKNVKLPKKGKIYDLGSGTGAAIFLLAEKVEANFIGIEKNSLLNFYAKQRLFFKKNKEKISFKNEDIENINLSDANLVYSYLSGKAYQKFGNKFAKEIKKGITFIALRFKFDHPQFKLQKTIKSKYPIYIYKKI